MKVTFIVGHLCKERHTLYHELATDLGAQGAEVTVITGYPSRCSDEVRKYYLAHPIEKVAKNVTVKRVGSKAGEGKSLLGRMFRYLFLTRHLVKEALKTPTDVYYVNSTPPFLGWKNSKLKKVAPVMYNAQDLFPDTLIHLKKFGEKNPMIKFFRKKEKDTYNGSTKIITISNQMKNTIANAGVDMDKIGVIYNWADTEKLYHVEKKDNALMDELNIDKSKFIISYAGTVGFFQGWQCIIETAKKLYQVNKDILFVIIGDGSYSEQFEKIVSDEDIKNILLLPMQPASRLPEIYSVGDVELVPIEPGISKTSLPSKTFVVMATGSPILSLVDEDSDVAKIIKEKNLGYTMAHGDSEGLKDLILKIYEERDSLPEKGKNALSFAKENVSRAGQTKKYFDVLSDLAGDKKE